MLITLIADLLRDDRMQKHFMADLIGVARKAGLTDSEMLILASRDLDLFGRAITEELKRLPFRPQWALPSPHITPPIAPRTGQPGEHIKNLRIGGEWFFAPSE